MMTLNGVIDLFALCIIGILCNVLDHRSYHCGPASNSSKFLENFHINDDANNISPEERRKCIRTRGLAYDLILWFFGTYTVTNNDTQQNLNWLTFFVPHIAQVTATLVLYVESYVAEYPGLYANIIRDEFRTQVNLCFVRKFDIEDALEKLLSNSSSDQFNLNTLAYTGTRNLTICRRDQPNYQSM